MRHSNSVDHLLDLITSKSEMNLYPGQLTELLSRLILRLKETGELNLILREMNSYEWTILYQAVLQVESGL